MSKLMQVFFLQTPHAPASSRPQSSMRKMSPEEETIPEIDVASRTTDNDNQPKKYDNDDEHAVKIEQAIQKWVSFTRCSYHFFLIQSWMSRSMFCGGLAWL